MSELSDFWEECKRLSKWPAMYDCKNYKEDDARLEISIREFGYVRHKIPERYYVNAGEQLAKFDYFYTPPDDKPDLRYVLSPYNWVPMAGSLVVMINQKYQDNLGGIK